MPRGKRATDHQIKTYYELRAQGMSRTNAARTVGGFTYQWGYKMDKIAEDPDATHDGASHQRAKDLAALGESNVGVRAHVDLKPEAQKALKDLEYFALRYFGVKLLPWQLEAAELIVKLLDTPHKEYLVVNCPPGAGKALALDTPLPTPTGWTTMKEVQIGDWLLDESGMPCRVTNKSEVFTGNDCFRVTTDDGHSVIADADHLWHARLPDARIAEPRRPGMTGPKPKTKDGWGTYNTRELARKRQKRAKIPTANPLILPALDLPIDPYVLGVWLGDGAKAGGEFACSHEDMPFIRGQFHEAGYATTDRSARQAFGVLGLKHDLRIAGVLNNKHIPAEYLRGSINQRRALLQGLIDSDGHVSDRGMVEFTNTNERLACQTLELIHSLGVKAAIHESDAKLNGRVIGPRWRITFYMADAARLPRKLERCKNGSRTPNRYLTIEPVESVPTQCVEVDSPNHLYLAGEGMLVTHNSAFFTRILPAWLTMRNRSLRGMIGSATISLAKNFVDHLRQEFDREVPVAATPQEIKNEMGFDAESTLAMDYGRIKPASSTFRWTATEFFVQQESKYMAAAKEPTWSALGRGTAFLGYRVDFAIWDDAWDPNSMKTAESREEFFRWWDGVAESRLEPGGLLVVVMQRLGPDDLSAHCLAKQLGAVDYALDEDEENVELDGRTADDSPPDGKKYWQIKYKAYYQELDSGPESRRPSSAPYPKGPLLTPRRIPWNECRDHMTNKPDMWETMYQQEDVAAASVLVKKVWISGGTDPETGEHHPGCIAGGTPVLTGRGLVPIEQVETSDQVMTRRGWRPVLHRTYSGRKEVLRLRFESGYTLDCTRDHPIYNPETDAWEEAGLLDVGDAALTLPFTSASLLLGQADQAGAVAAVPHPEGTVGVGMPIPAGGAPPVGSELVLACGHDFEVGGIDARRIGAQVVDLQPVGDRASVVGVGGSVGELLGAQPDTDLAIAVHVPRPVPNPTAANPVGPLQPELIVDCGLGGPSALSAGEADGPLGGLLGPPAVFTDHLVSVTPIGRTATWDIGVEDEHEFFANGILVHNCWDEERPAGVVPREWQRPLVSIATVDPSPANFWAIQWWVYQPDTNRRFLIDLIREKMGANDFLDWNDDTRMFTGIMQEWQTRSHEQDCPIQFWVVERNAAQRFMLQYNHTHNWIRHWGDVSIIEHNTSGENKNSIELGVTTIASKYRYGQVRLPGFHGDNSRLTSLKLVDEVTRYPGGRTDDQVMAHWFFEFRIAELEEIPQVSQMPTLTRPKWAKDGSPLSHVHRSLLRA